MFLAVLGMLPPAQAQTGKNEPPSFAPVINPAAEGRAVADRLLQAVPAESAEFRGQLKIRRRGEPIQILPLVSRLGGGATNWQMTYEIPAAAAPPGERLVVQHVLGDRNVYLHARGSNALAVVTGDALAAGLAGSDFALMDLGLEFLHWPHQHLLKRETRKGRACQVLESRPAAGAPAGYARVVSWIDAEADGVLVAEAYDAAGKLVKEFEVDKFTKVDGRWQLKRMEMRSPLRRSLTLIEFDHESPP